MSETVERKRGKPIQMPHVFALMFIIVILMAALTWIIPAGQYERIKEGTITKVVPNSFNVIDSSPQGLWDVFNAVVQGWTESAMMIFMVFFVGGAVKVLEETGTIGATMGKLVNKFKGKEFLSVVIIMIIMSIGGATGVFANPVVALMPLGIVLAQGLGYDSAVGFMIIYLGSYAGFNVGWGNLFTVGIAHQIAELPSLSGFNVRVLFHIVNLTITVIYTHWYIKRVQKDPTQSLLDSKERNIYATPMNNGKMTLNQAFCALITVASFGAIIYGSLRLKWGIADYSVVFFMMSVFCGIAGGLGMNETAKAFLKGCAGMSYAALVIGMARGISVVMTDGKIIDTIVYYTSLPIGRFGPVVGANLMLLFNIAINFFIPSGSGQAVTVMPVMVPMADLTGITRQVAVQAFQFGDGFTNCLIPTSSVLMGCLGLAGIPYSKYLKWIAPYILLQLILAAFALTVLQSIGWN